MQSARGQSIGHRLCNSNLSELRRGLFSNHRTTVHGEDDSQAHVVRGVLEQQHLDIGMTLAKTRVNGNPAALCAIASSMRARMRAQGLHARFSSATPSQGLPVHLNTTGTQTTGRQQPTLADCV